MNPKTETPEMDATIDPEKPSGNHVEALRRGQSHAGIDAQTEKRLNRKFDLRIMPWLFGIW